MDLSRSEALDKAEAALDAVRAELWHRVTPEPVTLMNALEALVTEHRRLLAEMHQRELHHFETEKLLTEAGIDPDAESEWEYECRIVADEPGWSWRSCTPDPRFCPSGSERRRRRPAGPWEPITEEEP